MVLNVHRNHKAYFKDGVAILASQSLISLMVSVDVNQHWKEAKEEQSSGAV